MSIDIRHLRETAKLTQAELARRLQKDQAQISRYEENPGSVPLDIILKILSALGVDPANALSSAASDRRVGIDPGVPHADLKKDLDLLRSVAETAPHLDETIPDGCPNVEQLLALVTALGRKPNLGFYGSFDTGKSTICNTLLGERFLPAQWQPATRIPTFVRHVEDRPQWFREQVWILDHGFNPQQWDDEEHCREHRIVAGGVETLKDYGVHNGRDNADDAGYALVYLNSPVLRACNIVDLPGFENSTEDTERATAKSVLVDVAIFASRYIGFLDAGELTRLGQIIRSLPEYEATCAEMSPLGNLFILATHAGDTAVHDKELNSIIDKASVRAFRQFGASILRDRANRTGRAIGQVEVHHRMFSFHVESERRRREFEADINRLLSGHLRAIWRNKADQEIVAFRNRARQHLSSLVDSYDRILQDVTAAQRELANAEESEPARAAAVASRRAAIEDRIAQFRTEAIHSIADRYRTLVNDVTIEDLIRERFNDKKDAQQYAAGFVFELLQHHMEQKTTDHGQRLAKDISAFLGQYDAASIQLGAGKFRVAVPFNAEGAFIGGLAGAAAVGALAAWAATLGNLGAYVIAAKAVSVLAALGIGVSGGTATAVAFLASIGGPLTVAVGIVAIFALVGFGLFGSSWQRKLAKKIVAEFNKRNVLGQFQSSVGAYWDSTLHAFRQGADAVERQWRDQVARLQAIVAEQHEAHVEPRERLDATVLARDFFAGLPWRAERRQRS